MRIVILGYGKMGHEVEQIALQRGHEVVYRIDTEQDWYYNIDGIADCDVVIEFSTPATAIANIEKCFELDIPMVVGTTGWYEHLDEISNRCKNEGHTLFYAPNFSIGMNFVFKLNKEMARFAQKYDYQLDITETHHIHKLDKPSGTAIKLAEDIIDNNENYEYWMLDDEDEPLNDDAKMLRVNAIREGEVFGIHEIKALSDCDEITLRHEAFSRKGFATGAVIAAEFIQNKKGIYTMEDLIES
ncbi:MAG: 4-hydroxy-tetrahydrodipicolinate reductase [Bacteroidales bacterium]|nr:4-hydroxy-tetrahydrodipicolinate reductase [Bacteroidales bacterium]